MLSGLFAGPAFATPFTTTVPDTGGVQIPGNYPEAGGIVLVLLGDNGNFYYQISNPSEMMRGFQDRADTVPQAFRGSPTWQLAPTYTLDCGTSTCSTYFGGGIQAGWVRFTAQDGDTSTTGGGNFDVNDITLILNGVDVGNWTTPATEVTNVSGTIATQNRFGFPNGAFATGWFPINNQALLDTFLVENQTVTWESRDADPNDNFWDFTIGNDADTTTVPERVAPGIALDKTALTTNFQAIGDTVNYSYFVENIGTVFIENISITDDQVPTVLCPQTRLDPGDTMTCTATDTVTQADLDAGGITNTATVTGTPQAATLGPITDQAFVPAINQTASLDIVKAPPANNDADGSGDVSLNDVLTYTITVTNTGTLTQTGIVITDSLTTPSSRTCASVAPGGTCVLTGTYSVTQADVDAGSISNTASATSTRNPLAISDMEVTAVAQRSELSIDKRALTSAYAAPGDVLSYAYDVVNRGTLTITSPITVTDDLIPSVSCPALPPGGLSPNATITCTGSYTVSQTNIDDGSVTNIASATDGTTTSPSDTVTINASQMPSLSMTKTATPQTYSAVGDAITYNYVVTNSGNTTLTDLIDVTDDQISVSCPALPAGGLAPNASLTCSAGDTITQADIDAGSLTNSAVATSGGTSSPSVSETVTATLAPALTLTKTATPETYSTVGDIIAYDYVITNSGNTTITNVLTVSDDRIATVSCPAIPAGGLLPGGSLTCSGQDVITQTDIDAGAVTNTATVSDGATTSPPVQETVTANQSPELTIGKTADASAISSPARVGEEIAYTITVENTGNVSLSSVVVSDPLLGGDVTSDCTFPTTSGELGVGETASCDVTYAITQADIDMAEVENTASAVGTPPTGGPISGVLPAPVETPLVQAPAFTVVKTATNINFTLPGDTVDYEYVVTNSGNVTITDPVSVSDDRIASVSCPALPVGGLAPAASITCTATYTVTQTDLDAGSVTNLASATDGTTTSALTSETIPASQNPGLTIIKTSPDTSFDAVGDVLTYDFRIENTGNLTLTGDIEVTDDRIGTFVCFTGNLVPGASATCRRTDTATLADLDAGAITNQAYATNGGLTSTPVSLTLPADLLPALSIDKRALNSSFNAMGDTLSYEYTVRNTGNVTISGITLGDDRIGTISCPQTVLAPTVSMTCSASDTVSQADLDAGRVTNIATGTGMPSGGTLAPATDQVTVDATQSPSLTFEKTALNSSFSSVGETLQYQYRLQNTGNVTISGLSVTDDRIASISCPQTMLAPGQVVVCTGSDITTQADLDAGFVTNNASASGTPAGGTLPPAIDRATINANTVRALSIAKSAAQANFDAAGDILTYTYSVTNNGNVTLTSPVTVSDDRIPSVSCSPLPAGGLSPGDSLACSASYTVSQADVDAGSVTNTASASSGGTTSPADSVTVAAIQTPAISVVKTAVTTDYDAAGDFIDYTYQVTNTGNTTLMSAVTVSDDRILSVNCPAPGAGGLAPGATITCSGRYQVTQADVDAGSVINLATASAGGVVSAQVSETVTANQAPALSMTKVASPSVFSAAGDTINYTYTVRNSGNVTVTDPVTVTDDRIASVTCNPLPTGGLAPNATIVCTGSDSVTQADIDAGFVTNLATASAGSLTSPQISETATADQMPELTMVKSATTINFTLPGDITSYDYAVTNTGNVTVTTPISVTDNLIPVINCPALPAGGLLPGDTLTCTGDYVATQDDLDRGSVTNLASASDGTTDAPLVSETIPANANPSMQITKTALETSFSAVGDVLNYEYEISNNGNVTLTGLTSVVDDRIGTITCFNGNLTPGDEVTCQATYIVTQADIDAGEVTNTAYGENLNAAITSGIADATVPANQTPSLILAKTALTAAFAMPGDTLDYEYVVTNSGNTTVRFPIEISDNRIASVTCPPLPAGGLLPGAQITCTATDTVSQFDIDQGAVSNTAIATDGVTTSASVTETVSATQNRALTVAKIALDTDFAAVGDTLDYEYILTNTGNTTLLGALSVTDDRIANIACPPLPAGGLAPSAQLTCTGSEIVTQTMLDTGSVTNTATASIGTTSGAPVSETVMADLAPELTVTKSVDDSGVSDPVRAGDSIIYTVRTVNTGNVTLTDVTVSDPLLGGDITGLCAFPGTIGTLAVGADAICTASYTILQADIDAGGVMNSALAIARDPAGALVSDRSDAGNPSVETPGLDGFVDGDPTNDPTVTFFGPAPSLAINKEALTTSFNRVGDTLQYQYVVTNTGNVTLTEAVTVSDDRIAAVNCPALPTGGLAPAAQITCTGEDTVTQADLDAGEVVNLASASIAGVSSPEVSATVAAAQEPGFVIAKMAGTPVQVAGPLYDVTYTITVTNTGNVTVNALALEDDLASAVAPATISGEPTLSFDGFSGPGGLNAAFDGVSEFALLAGDVQLGVGETGTVMIATRVDISTGTPTGGNTVFGINEDISTPVPSDDPTETPGNPNDTNPTRLDLVDTDGDGVPDGAESETEDRDGDGIPDAEDYDPTGYFYCQESGAILTGGRISVSGPAGSNASIGTANNITIVRDGSDGFYQFFVTAPGRYTLTPAYPLTGEPSVDRLPEEDALDVTSALPANPALLGSTEVGNTGRLADASAAANTPFYFAFDIEPGDPAIFANNIPLQSCGTPAIDVTKTVIGDPERLPDGRVQVEFEITAVNTGETVLEDVLIEDDLAAVFGAGTTEPMNLTIVAGPQPFSSLIDADYDGETSVTMTEEGGDLLPGESVTTRLVIAVEPEEAGEFTNTARVRASPPLADDGTLIAPNGGVEVTDEAQATLLIAALTDPSQLRVTKLARPGVAQIGDAIRYEIQVENVSASAMTDLRIIDRPPAGLAYVPGSAVLSFVDGTALPLEPEVSRGVLAWTLSAEVAAPFDVLEAGETVTLDLSMVATPSAEFGELTNTAFVQDALTGSVSESATATIEFIPEPTFDCTPVIGRVFHDVNGNGYPDEGEPGIPGARVNTVHGDIITTDEHGRYHIPCAIIADQERGSNFILKTDPRSLPLGYTLTTQNPRVVRATRGKFLKINFGAVHQETLRIDVTSADFDEEGALLRSVSTELPSDEAARNVLIIYRASGEESVASAQTRLATVRQALGDKVSDIAFEVSYDADTPVYTGPVSEGPGLDARLGPILGEGEPVSDDSPPSYLERSSALSPEAAPSEAYRDAPTIETTVDALYVEKQLSLTTELALSEDGERMLYAHGFWNYGHWINTAELRIFKEGESPRATPLVTIELDELGAVALPLDFNTEGNLAAVLRVYDVEGRFDETRPRLVRVVEDEALPDVEEAGDRAFDAFGADAINFSNIPVNGATVRVYGRNITGETVSVFGQTIRVDSEGRFVAEAIRPDGEQWVDVTASGQRVLREIDVKTRDIYGVGLFETTLGQRRTDDGLVTAEGRAAFYVRGRLSPRIRVTATADTGEASIEDLFDQFDERDSRSLLRRLDPDKFYPVYGDDSTIEEDAPTSGRFYLRVERDDDYALWGNYRTNFNDTEFSRIERTLYGAKLHWDENGNPTALGDARTALDAFISDPGTRSARDELRGTGGSVYFLRNADISIGTDIVRVETRDVISGIVLESRPLIYGEDYDIDYIQGRIILNQPLTSTSEDGRLFADGTLSGNEVFLVAEYEFTSGLADFDQLAFGGRGTRWFGDHLKVGATYARDIQDGAETDIFGADIVLQATGDTYLRAEFALTDGAGLATFRSLDGGFTFVQEVIPGGTENPLAFLVEAAANLSDFGFGEGRITAYFRSREAGFAGFGEQAGDDTTQYGLALDAPLTERVELNARADVVEGGFAGERSVIEAAITTSLTDQLSVQTGLSYQDDTIVDDSLAVAARLTYAVNESNNAYVFAQTGLTGSDNADLTDRFGLGGELRISDKLTAGAEVSSGAAGLGSQVSIRYARDELSETYLTYDLPTRSNVGERAGGLGGLDGGLTLGARQRLTDSLSIFGEERRRFGTTEAGLSGTTHAYGVDYAPNEAWTFGVSGEFGDVGPLDREAVSLNVGFASGGVNIGGTAEFRFDENRETGEDLEAFLLRFDAQAQISEGLRFQTKVNHANADGSANAGAISFQAAEFTEASIAAAYRPVANDRLNLLAKAVFLEDLSPAGQRLNGDILDFRQRSVILSIDATYDLTQRCSVGGKYGFRQGEVTEGRDSTDFFSAEAWLAVGRLDCTIVNKWDGLLEARYLEIGDGVTHRWGGLAGIYRNVGDHAKIGGGLTWGGVDDDFLALNSERDLGWFLNLIGKF